MLNAAVPDTWVYHSWNGMRGKKSIRRCLMPGMVPEFILVLYILVNKSVLGNNNAQYWLYRWGRDGGYGYIKGSGPYPPSMVRVKTDGPSGSQIQALY